jgi:hypothetical protein
MWPLTWSTASAEGSLEGGFLFGWNDVVTAALILALQLAFIGYIWRSTQKAQESA